MYCQVKRTVSRDSPVAWQHHNRFPLVHSSTKLHSEHVNISLSGPRHCSLLQTSYIFPFSSPYCYGTLAALSTFLNGSFDSTVRCTMNLSSLHYPQNILYNVLWECLCSAAFSERPLTHSGGNLATSLSPCPAEMSVWVEQHMQDCPCSV